jgi:hypothetical protein
MCVTVSITMLRHYAECHYASVTFLFIVTLNVIILNVVMLSVVVPFGRAHIVLTGLCRCLSKLGLKSFIRLASHIYKTFWYKFTRSLLYATTFHTFLL